MSRAELAEECDIPTDTSKEKHQKRSSKTIKDWVLVSSQAAASTAIKEKDLSTSTDTSPIYVAKKTLTR